MSLSKLKLLFIEDEHEMVDPVIGSLRDCECQVISFSECQDAIEQFIPDIILLDILDNVTGAEPTTPGLDIFDWIWKSKFCPIIVYSAQPELLNNNPNVKHPFIKSLKKGKDSIEQIKILLAELKPQVDALQEAEKHIREQFAYALRDVAPYAFEAYSTDSEKRIDMIKRAGRRRLAALMDDLSRHNETLVSWEQYLFPPVSKNIQLADILHEIGRPNDDPTSFFVVLTPSCDMVSSSHRLPKVDNILGARCCSFKEGLDMTKFKDLPMTKWEKSLPNTVLSQGCFDAILPLPALKGRIPHMVANLRDLDLIPLDLNVCGRQKFERVASIDSPFREMVAWAYLQIGCRPGLPDRDFEKWSTDLVEASSTITGVNETK